MARRSVVRRRRVTRPRDSSVSVTSVALAFDQSSRRRSVRSPSSPARGGQHHQRGEARRGHALALELGGQDAADGGLGLEQRLQGAMGERVAELQVSHEAPGYARPGGRR